MSSPGESVLFLSDADVRQILQWRDVVRALAAAYRTPNPPQAAPPRVIARSATARVRVLAAAPASNECMGIKVIARSANGTSTYPIALWKRETGALVCILDGVSITAMRTAGTSALAVDRLTGPDPIRLAVLGSGKEAAAHVSAIAAMRRITGLRVYSPTAEKREDFSERFSKELGVQCCATDDARTAIDGANVIVAAARSRDESPILEGAWLEAGVMVISIGSTLPEQREVDVEVIRRADNIVADMPDEILNETGDMLAARQAGVECGTKLVPLADVIQGLRTIKQHKNNIVVYKSAGAGLQDIAVAEMCFVKAQEQRLGKELPLGFVTKSRSA